MKYLWIALLFVFFYQNLVGQNPIVKEEHYEQEADGEPYLLVTIIERSYENDSLSYQKTLYFAEELNDWYTGEELWFDHFGNEIKKIYQYYQGPEEGFFRSDTYSKYTADGKLLSREEFIADSKDSPAILAAREEVIYLEDCSFLHKYFRQENPNDAEVVFNYQVLHIYDEECRFVKTIYTRRSNDTAERLRSQIRIHFDKTIDGQKRRIVEQVKCPDTFGCTDWERISLMVFDDQDRIIIQEENSREDYFRINTTTSFEPTQTIYETRIFVQLLNDGRQELFSLDEIIRDENDKLLSYKRREQTSYETRIYLYNDKGLLIQENFERFRMLSSGDEIFFDTIYHNYQYHCNDLVFEKNIIWPDYRRSSRTVYSYLNPIDCASIIEENLSLTIFPNPTSNRLNIQGLDFSRPNLIIDIVDSSGRIIETRPTISSNMDVSHLVNGLYFIRIKNRDGSTIHAQSFIKAR